MGSERRDNGGYSAMEQTERLYRDGRRTTRYDLYLSNTERCHLSRTAVHILQFEAQLDTTDALPSGIQSYAGFYDETAGQRKYIEGGAFTITDENGNNPGVTFRYSGLDAG
jgi:hypothetical protein